MDVKKTLKNVAYKALRNFDFVMAGVCLVFALTARPFLTSFETDRLENAKERYEEVHPRAQAFATQAGQPDSIVQDEKALNLYLFDQRGNDAEIRSLSDDFRSARADLRRAESTYKMSSTMGHIFGGTFAAMGIAFAAGGIANRRRDKKQPAP